ncbi:transposase [Paraflavisolibacter sp. H34]|uniref:IS66 family insertion sequence element accessory protein TnpA n=1 Tax=Huijunlia imazamoxiresistens TaxID=3127457 RepID=UPI00301B11E4
MNTTPKKSINRRTDAEKLGLIQEWEKSDLSIASFCRQHGFSDSLFHTWLKRYRPKGGQQSNSDFVPLQLPAAPAEVPDTPSLYAELVLAGGTNIKFYQPVAATYLRTLIS